MGNQLRSPTNIGHLSLSDNSTDDYLYVNGVPITGGGGSSYDLNLENGTGDYSIVQKETSAHKGQATGKGSIVFGGFRGDKPNNTPNPIPADDATVSNISSDAYNDTVSKVAGIQSVVFGAGNRAYGDWNFIAGKDSKTTSRGSFAFGGKNYVGDPSNPSKYLWSMAVGGSNIIGSDYSFAAGSKNHLSSSYQIGLGYDNILRSNSAKAIGNSNIIDNNGNYSIAIGNGLRITQPSQIALGNYNTPGDANTLLVLGNGASETARSNAFEVTKTGIARAYGTPVGNNDLTPKNYVDARVSANPAETGTTDLTKLKVGDTVYNIPSGGGSELYEHIITLYVSSNFSLKLIVLSNRGTQYNLNDLQGLMEIRNFVRGEFSNDGYDHVYVITDLLTPETPTDDFNVSYLGASNLYMLSYMAMNENSYIYDNVIQL